MEVRSQHPVLAFAMPVSIFRASAASTTVKNPLTVQRRNGQGTGSRAVDHNGQRKNQGVHKDFQAQFGAGGPRSRCPHLRPPAHWAGPRCCTLWTATVSFVQLRSLHFSPGGVGGTRHKQPNIKTGQKHHLPQQGRPAKPHADTSAAVADGALQKRQ